MKKYISSCKLCYMYFIIVYFNIMPQVEMHRKIPLITEDTSLTMCGEKSGGRGRTRDALPFREVFG